MSAIDARRVFDLRGDAPKSDLRRADIKGRRDEELRQNNGGDAEGDEDAGFRQQRPDRAAPAKSQQQRQARHRRRHHDGQLDEQADETFAAESITRKHEGKRRTQQRGQANDDGGRSETQQHCRPYRGRIGQVAPGL